MVVPGVLQGRGAGWELGRASGSSSKIITADIFLGSGIRYTTIKNMAGSVWILDAPAAAQLQHRLHFAYPVVLLLFFLVTFMSHSIISSDPAKTSTEAPVSGPGGKPLPRNKRRHSPEAPRPQARDFSPAAKAFFTWTTVAVSLTFLAHAALVLLHVLVARSEGWWCGQHAAVSRFSPLFYFFFSPRAGRPGPRTPDPLQEARSSRRR